MLQLVTTKQFEKDIKLACKRAKDLRKVRIVIELLLKNKILPEKYRDHKLSGNYANRRECHIEPDWLLLYKLGEKEIILERIGTHADLFR